MNRSKNAPRKTHQSTKRPDGTGRSVPLRVLPPDHTARKPIKPSRNAPKRAIVLAIVQILLIAHVIQWVVMGTTTTPIEPSESMEFSRRGIINAGLIFFAIALLSTMFLGRWVCGWGCHVVMLQDLCSWMMKKIGIRPRAFRSRFLVYVPLILAIYMFLWPAFYRLAVAPWIGTAGLLEPWRPEWHLTTENFWQTFPGVMVAIPFLLVCGFAAVYFLGSKGFCTYGCPYGGFFAPLDELAFGRIRVTDDCQQSGHCTARCSSNVRVHDEVREYGMVVDPGCMKCLDCVSICPNNALYFGFGKPAISKGPPKQKPLKVKYDLTLREEFAMSAVFLLSFLAYRGVYGLIPLLMAIGMAGVTTFLVWKFWRMWWDSNVSFHRYRFKSNGRITQKGIVFGSMAMLVILFTAHSGVVRSAERLGAWHDNRITIPIEAIFDHGSIVVEDEERERARKGLAFYGFASAIGHGGIGLSTNWQPMLDVRMAWLNVVLGEYDRAESLVKRALDRNPADDMLSDQYIQILLVQEKIAEAREAYVSLLLEHRDLPLVLSSYAQWSAETGRLNQAIDLLGERLEHFEDDPTTHYWLGVLLLESRDFSQGIVRLRHALELSPHNPDIVRMLALGLIQTVELEEAESILRDALDAHPDHPGLMQQLALILNMQGRVEEANELERRAEEAPEGHAVPGPEGSPLTR